MALTVRTDSLHDRSPYVTEDGNTYIAHPSPNVSSDESPRSQTHPYIALYNLNTKVLDLSRVWQEGGGNGGLGLDVVIRTKSIQALILSHNQLDPETIPQISSSLTKCLSLRVLDLDDCKMTHTQLKALADALEKNPPLESLSLRKIVYPVHLDENPDHLTPARIPTTLQPLFARNTRLENLVLADNNLGPTEGESLGAALQTNSSLRSLDLSSNQLGTTGGLQITQALVRNTALHTLSLRFCGLTPENASAFKAMFAVNSTLTALDLSDNPLDEQGGRDIGTIIKTSSFLFSLNIANCAIPSAGCQVIATSLNENTALRVLNLSHNTLDDHAVSSIAKAVSSTSTLYELSLIGDALTAEQGAIIATAIRYNTVLTSLQLGDHCLQYETTCQALHQSLVTNSTLISISPSPLHYYPTPALDRPLYPRPAIRSAVDDRLEINMYNSVLRRTTLFERLQQIIFEMEWEKLCPEKKNQFNLRYRQFSNQSPPLFKQIFLQDTTLFWQVITDAGLRRHFEFNAWSWEISP